MREVLEAAGLAVGEDDAGGFKKGSPFHLIQESFNPVGRIIAVPVENPVEKAMVPDPGVHFEGEGQMYENGVGGFLHQAQVEPAGA